MPDTYDNGKVLAEALKNLSKNFDDFKNQYYENRKDDLEEIKSLRRALYTVAFTIAGSAITFAFAVLLIIGKH